MALTLSEINATKVVNYEFIGVRFFLFFCGFSAEKVNRVALCVESRNKDASFVFWVLDKS